MQNRIRKAPLLVHVVLMNILQCRMHRANANIKTSTDAYKPPLNPVLLTSAQAHLKCKSRSSVDLEIGPISNIGVVREEAVCSVDCAFFHLQDVMRQASYLTRVNLLGVYGIFTVKLNTR